MIRTLLTLLGPKAARAVRLHLALTVVSVVLRAAAVVVLVPLLAALFGDDPSAAWPWVGALAVLTAAGWGVDWVLAGLGADLGFGLLATAQHTVSERLARVRLSWFDARSTATAREAMAATGPDLVGLVVYLVTPLLSAVLLPVAIGIALLFVAWPLGVAALAGVPLLLGAFWASVRLSAAADVAAAESNSALTERIVEFARTQPALRAARRVAPERSHVGSALSTQHDSAVRSLLMQIPGQLLFTLASQAALVLLAATTVWLTVEGTVSIPEAIALIVVVVRYLEPFTSLAGLAGALENVGGILGKFRAVLEAPEVERGAGQRETGSAPRIELRGVGFGYAEDDALVLDDLDLTLEAGTTTAIVGPSGSGKSTILALLAGLHEPTSGSVLVDGIDAATLDSEARRELVSMVFQNPYLFDGSIADNVRAGDPAADDAALGRAATLARVDDVLHRLPDGWDTRVGEAGTSLSGGERQRVSIARAVLKPAPVLLIDEATSALDTENEAAVTRALHDDPMSRTRVIVAHRLASIRSADRVVLLEDGRIVEDGSVDDLLAAGGRFAEFWRHQDAATRWQLGRTEG